MTVQPTFVPGRAVPPPVLAPRAAPPRPPSAARGPAPQAPPARPGGPVVMRKGGGSSDAFLVNLPPSHGGQPLPDTVREKMEASFGASLSDVRVHVGPQAASIGAVAFTRGSDIYFAPGQYQPHAMHGQQLLGHELAHVLQQRQGRVQNPFGTGVAVVQDRHLEAEADRLGLRAAMTVLPKKRPGA